MPDRLGRGIIQAYSAVTSASIACFAGGFASAVLELRGATPALVLPDLQQQRANRAGGDHASPAAVQVPRRASYRMALARTNSSAGRGQLRPS